MTVNICNNTTINLGGGVTKQTIYCLGRHLDKEEDEEEKSDFSFFLLIHPSKMKLRKQEGRQRRRLSCKVFSNTTINPWECGKTNNLLSGLASGQGGE